MKSLGTHTVSMLTAGALACAALPAVAQTFTAQPIDAKASIFEASPANATDGTAPPMFVLSPGLGRTLTFSSVVGLTYGSAGTPTFGPDSGNWFGFGTNISSLGAISGVIDNNPGSALALLGVFTTDAVSGSAPARQNYTGTAKNALTYAPLLNQTFFIGDGLTGTGNGTVQLFAVPDNATRLFLGFADAGNFNGTPGLYNDNVGALTASFFVQQVPEPHTVLLMSAGLLTVALRGRRKTCRRSVQA